MNRTESKELVKNIFSNKATFEKYVLEIDSEVERKAKALALSSKIIQVLLLDELNFLYMQNLDAFKLSLIQNLIFKEFASEWMLYACHKLKYSREDAMREIEPRERVIFLLSVVKIYFQKYKIYFAQEIANTFIELIGSMPTSTLDNELVKEVLKSEFLKENGLCVVNSYNQLWSRVKKAQEYKENELKKLGLKIKEFLQEKDMRLVKKFEYEEALLEEKALALFDQSIKHIRDTMVNYIMFLK